MRYRDYLERDWVLLSDISVTIVSYFSAENENPSEFLTFGLSYDRMQT